VADVSTVSLGRPAIWTRERLNCPIASALATTALLAVAAFVPSAARAQDATWSATPGSGDFTTPGNWSPAAVPTGTAFFGTSSITALSLSTDPTTIGGWTFNAGASAYTFSNSRPLVFTGAGIAVNGGSATITNDGGMFFRNASTAGSATITNFHTLSFQTASTAGTAAITNNDFLSFDNASTAGSAAITNNDFLTFFNASTAGSARITNGAGGNTDFSGSTGPLGDHKLSAGSIAGGGTFRLGQNELSVGSNNLSSTVTGVIADGGLGGGIGGSLVKIGTGTLTLAGTNTYTGGTTINGGALEVDGSIASSILTTVNAGAFLGGAGIVGNSAIKNGGTFAPGNTTAGSSMAVSGNLAFQSGALYLVQLDPTTSSLANVAGTATLAGTVHASFAPGSYMARQYVILRSAGLGGTTFDAVSTNLPNFGTSLSYNGTDVLLNLTAALGTQQLLLSGQHNVANAINNFFNNGGGPMSPGFGALFGLSGSNLSAALSQVSGEVATGSQQTTFDAMGLFMGLLTDPFIDGRGDPVSMGSSTGASAYASQDRPRSGAARDANAMLTKAPAVADPFAQRWSVWAAGYGGAQTTDGNAALGSNNTTSRIFGAAVGADYRLSPYTLAGFALAGGGTNFSVVNSGSGRSDLFQAGAFIRHNAGAAYFSGALAYGWQDITTNRTVTVAGLDQLRAEFNANAWSGRVEGGYRFVSPWTGGIGITPYAAGQFATFDLPAYAEQAITGTNTFALSYGAKSVTASRSELGVRTDKSFAVQDGIFTLRGRVAWAHNFNTDRSVLPTFQALPGASFVVNGAAQAADAALATASAEMKWLNGFSVAGTFEGEFSNVTESYAGKGVVRYAW
jgi:autotransporter-associated beta strand protein